ncbi:MAG: 6-carboxytetrahydropterin synthase [Candidatus Kapabacteria bacterium]|nr:6-carboxytetrahydropterin synthase [Candidatus Kapabacteria bacterium]
MIYVTKRVEFSASHRLFNPLFDENKNNEIFDKCNNINGHGHNYVLDVTVAGIPDPETGYVIDLKLLKKIINEELIVYVDHKHLNFDVDFLEGIIPTAEHLAVLFWQKLEIKIKNGKLHKIVIYETANSFVEYYGEPIEIKVYN